jgi:hypothetical protein
MIATRLTKVSQMKTISSKISDMKLNILAKCASPKDQQVNKIWDLPIFTPSADGKHDFNLLEFFGINVRHWLTLLTIITGHLTLQPKCLSVRKLFYNSCRYSGKPQIWRYYMKAGGILHFIRS